MTSNQHADTVGNTYLPPPRVDKLVGDDVSAS